jgi:hypothetical protein
MNRVSDQLHSFHHQVVAQCRQVGSDQNCPRQCHPKSASCEGGISKNYKANKYHRSQNMRPVANNLNNSLKFEYMD